MRPRALVLSLAGCAAALALTWDVGRGAAPPSAPGRAAAAPAKPPATPSAGSPAPHASSGSTTAPSPTTHAPHASEPAGPSGTFAGATADTAYGPVQVAIVVRSGRITDVKALQLTNQGGRSVAISAAAAPQLRTEALRAQSARIDTISGASYTSEGYRTSLQSAIDKAGL